MTFKRIIFFDSTCNFCCSYIRQVMRWDKSHIFSFAPLQGETAKTTLGKSSQMFAHEDSLLLWDEKKAVIYCYSQAVSKIFWMLGGLFKLLGWLSFFPSIGKGLYKFIAKRRHFFKKVCFFDEKEKERLLP